MILEQGFGRKHISVGHWAQIRRQAHHHRPANLLEQPTEHVSQGFEEALRRALSLGEEGAPCWLNEQL